MGNTRSRKKSGSKIAQTKLPIGPKKWRSGGISETDLSKKGKGKDEIDSKHLKTGIDPEVICTRIVTPPRNNKDKENATYVSMLVKLPALKKAINTLQQRIAELVDML